MGSPKGSRPGSRGAAKALLPSEARMSRAGPMPILPPPSAAQLAPAPGGMMGPGGAGGAPGPVPMGPPGAGGGMKKGGSKKAKKSRLAETLKRK